MSSFRGAFRLGVLVTLGACAGCSGLLRTSGVLPPPQNLRYVLVDCALIAPRSIDIDGGGQMLLPSRLERMPAIQCYREGGIPQYGDTLRTLKWWLASACESGDPEKPATCKGDPEAQYRVAEMYEDGLGSAPRMVDAAAWYLRAARQEHRPSAAKIALFYEEGLGVPRSDSEAAYWYREAAGASHERYAGCDPASPAGTRSSDADDCSLSVTAPTVSDGAPTPCAPPSVNSPSLQRCLKLKNTPPSQLILPDEVEELQRCGPPEHNHVIVFGNSDYQNWDDLPAAERDADEIATLLHQQWHFTLHDRGHVNAKTVDDLLGPIYDLNEDIKRNRESANLVIVYSGHGAFGPSQDPSRPKGYWIPTDAPGRDVGPTIDWLDFDELARGLARMHSIARVLIIADACYAGVKPGTENVVGKANMLDPALTPSRWLLSAAGDQPAYEVVGAEHSIFATALLDVIRHSGQTLTGRDLYDAIRRRVRVGARGVGVTQTPKYGQVDRGDAAGDFIFAHRP